MKAASFLAQTGKKPVAGIDYDPDEPMCQDDYEYFTGTGGYSNSPMEDEMSERWTVVETMTGWDVKKYNAAGVCYKVIPAFATREAALKYCKNRGFTSLSDR